MLVLPCSLCFAKSYSSEVMSLLLMIIWILWIEEREEDWYYDSFFFFRSLGWFSSIVARLIAWFVCLSVRLFWPCVNTYMPLRPVESCGITRSRVATRPKHTHTNALSSSSCDAERFRTLFRFCFPILNPNYFAVLQRPFFFGARPQVCNCGSRDLFQLEGSLFGRFSSGFELDHTRLGIC